MKIKDFIKEASEKGYGITFVDIDETLFRTFAKIKVWKGGKLIKELTNQEYNNYKLKEGESFDFGEFKSADLFSRTSIPIPKTITMVKKMLAAIKEGGLKSKIIFLTARGDFDNKKLFLATFKKYGIDVDSAYVERAGNLKYGTTADKKKWVIMKYLKSGDFRRVRMYDDDITNLKYFLTIENELPNKILNKVRKKYDIPENEEPIKFYAYHVKHNGSTKKFE